MSSGQQQQQQGESQPLLKSGADVKPVYFAPRQGSAGNAADVRRTSSIRARAHVWERR